MMRTLGVAIVLLAVAAGGFYANSLLHAPPTPQSDPVTHRSQPTGPTIEQVQKLSDLVILRVPISDLHVSELEGFTGGVKLAMAVHGDVEIATDLSAATFDAINHEQRSAILLLPQPKPARPRLDHEKTRILELQRNGAWRFIGGEAGERVLTNRAMTAAQRLLSETADQADLTQKGWKHTQAVIGQFFNAMDWDVQVQWQDKTTQHPQNSEE